MARIRTTKKLAARIELEYFKRSHPFRRWLRLLSFGGVAIAIAGLVVLAVRGDQRIYTSGPVSTRHAMFGADCARCHVLEAARPMVASAAAPAGKPPLAFWLRAADAACLNCHDGPVHHDNQIFTPRCASCHVEHEGHVALASLTDPHCVQCHADLKTKGQVPKFGPAIRHFATGHPEFAVLRAGQKDTARMKLNHEKHLKAGLRGPKGPVQMTCSDCHRASLTAAPWPFSQVSMAGSADPSGGAQATIQGQGAYMHPIEYEPHCAGCHILDFDPRLQGVVAPHEEPQVIHAFLLAKFTEVPPQPPEQPKVEEEEEGRSRLPGRRRGTTEVLEENQEAEERPRRLPGRRAGPEAEEKESREEGGRARLPGRGRAEEAQESPSESIAGRVKNAERFLFKKCQECHTLEAVPGKLPTVVKTAIPAQWLAHSIFNHRSHRMLTCTECHEKARTSQETTDVLLPGIQVCLQCHREKGGARSGCVQCHLYHDKTKERDVSGRFTIRMVVTGASLLADAEKERTPARR